MRGGGGADSGISSASVSVFDADVSSGGVGSDFAFFFRRSDSQQLEARLAQS